ncbi:hypothetical protein OS493_027127 [Desmophyllum pertusum]|uniref:Fibronectin type-III domain-containing protein n=1 Tax=Desmophyllum pertusum TaxID=174260 RepID=A0A9W9ZYB2_9CNID|nr:hypothetical protein OS493_027127 [Desmophyllum pertusum]
MCGSKCNHPEGRCDEITGKCICDGEGRNVEWCLEGEPKKIFNLYKDAASYWALDSVEDLKDRARLGWGTAHGEVTLVPKGLSGHALQLDGVSGWIDLGDLGPACAEANCSEDFSISMWMKYYPKESEEDQSFLTFRMVAPYRRLSCGMYVTHAHALQTSNTSVMLGAGSFPNASFDEIAIWRKPLQKEKFVDIYNTYKGPARLNVQLSLRFTDISWSNNFSDPESQVFTTFLQSLTDEITAFYLNVADVLISSENISLSNCCSGYKQLGLLLNDWLPRANVSRVVRLWSRNDNVPSTPVPGLTARATGASSVEVSWGTPSENDLPGILIGYAIYYKTMLPKNDPWVRKTTENTDEPYAILKLKGYMYYTVNVTTVSLEGEGIAASVNVMTQEDAPPRPPAHVNASSTSSTSIELAWDPPEGRIPGVIRGYRIFYTKAAGILDQTSYTTVDNEIITNYIANDTTLMNETAYDVPLLKYEITGLELYTKYCVWMRVFTVADSPNSHAVFLFTDEGGK